MEGSMNLKVLRKWAALLASGAVVLQTTSCGTNAAVVTSVATTLTAGGVLYLVYRVATD
jgi:hypothetical protein